VRKKHRFNTKAEWAAYAVHVAKSQGGSVQINHYAWVRGQELARAVKHAVDLGLMECDGGPMQRRWYSVKKPSPRDPA